MFRRLGAKSMIRLFNMKKEIKKLPCIILCVVVLLLGVAPFSFADWYDDVKSGCTWVEIKGDNFVADTFCSVDALYSENSYYYQCNELIMRFYKEAYGLDVLAYSNTGLIAMTEGYKFVEAKTPKKGDVIFVSAEMRNSSSDHWAIVKDYSGGYITMFEQNVIWDGKAAVNRQIKYPSDSYYLFTLTDENGNSVPLPNGIANETTVPTTTARPTTTKSRVTTTAKAKETTTEKATTKKATTTAPTVKTTATTLPETTQTTAPATTETTTAESTIYMFSTVFVLTTQSQTQIQLPEESGKSTTVFLAIACIILAAAVAAVTIRIIKMKNNM